MSILTPSRDATPEGWDAAADAYDAAITRFTEFIREAFLRITRERYGEDVRIDAEALLGVGSRGA